MTREAAGGGRVTGARVLVRRGDAFLLVRQRSAADPAGTFWLPPGGTVEPGEPPARAAARELREETGCELDAIWPLGTVPRGGQRATAVFGGRLRPGSPEPRAAGVPGEGIVGVDWLRPDDAALDGYTHTLLALWQPQAGEGPRGAS